MKHKVLNTEIKRKNKKTTICNLTVGINDNEKIIKPSIKTFISKAIVMMNLIILKQVKDLLLLVQN